MAKHVPASVECSTWNTTAVDLLPASEEEVNTFHVKRWEPQQGGQLMRLRRRQGARVGRFNGMDNRGTSGLEFVGRG